MLKEFWTKNKTHIIIIGIFLAVSVLYCYPILSGKVMNQNDEKTAKALNREAEEYAKKTGEFVGWSNSMFSGMPTSVGYNGPSNYSISLIYAFANAFHGYSFDVIFWCFIGMYIIFVALGINPWLGALGSFIFAFSSYNILSLTGGHVQKVFNIAFIPLLLSGIYLIFQKRYLWGFVVTAFGVNYQVGLAHYQVTYYSAIAAVIMCIFYGIRWIREKEYKALGIAIGLLLGASVLGGLANVTLINSYYASKETTRGNPSELTPKKDAKANPEDEAPNKEGLDIGYAAQYSYGPAETFTFLIPNASGGANGGGGTFYGSKDIEKKSEALKYIRQQQARDPNGAQQLFRYMDSYWGDQPFVGGPYYFGALVMFLFVFGIVAAKGFEKWWILSITGLFMFLGWGGHSYIFELFFNYAPAFNKFRTPSIALSVVQIGIALIAIMGLKELISPASDKKKLFNYFKWTAIGFGGLFLLLIVAPGQIFGLLNGRTGFLSTTDVNANLPEDFVGALIDDRKAMMMNDLWRSLVYILLGAVAMFFYFRGTLKANVMIGALALFIVVDLMSFNSRYLNERSYVKRKEFNFRAEQYDQTIYNTANQMGLSHYRVFNTTENPTTDARTSYFHHSIGGYHGAKLRKYQELIENQITYFNRSVMNMLNMQFYLVQGQQEGLAAQMNPEACGNAWFVKEVKVVENADQEMAGLNVDSANNFNPLQTLVVQKKNLPADLQNFKPGADSSAKIELTEYMPHRLKYESNSASDQMAVFSEVFYKQEDGDGWEATVDGQPAEFFRGDYILRAMKVPAGKHTIEFRYNASKSLGRVRLSFVFFLVLLGVSGFAIWRDNKMKKKLATVPATTADNKKTVNLKK